MKDKRIKITLEYAKNIYKVLDDFESMGYKVVSQEIKDMISKEAYDKLVEIYMKHHNANCGPFNRLLRSLIENKEKELE